MRFPRAGSQAMAMLVVASGSVAVGACTALWGLDDLSYDGISGTSSSTNPTGGGGTTTSSSSLSGGSSTTTSSSSGSTTTGTGTGAVACGTDCGSCLQTACMAEDCQAVVVSCAQQPGCHALSTCMLECDPADAVCQGDCVALSPSSVALFYEALDCVGCESPMDACALACEPRCAEGCSQPEQSCVTCINDGCALAVCAEPVSACSAEAECMSVANCVADCPPSDSACKNTCADEHPEGAALYNAVIRCTTCTRTACWDRCALEGVSCAGFGSGA